VAEPALEIDLRVEHADWAGLEGAVIEALARVGDIERVAGDVAVLLTGDAAITVLNRDWRGKDKATNVLSFPAPETPGQGARFWGDIVMAVETIALEAQDQGKSVQAHAAHMAVHGLLHLLGYDHEIESEAEAMEARERAILASLGIDDPYAERAPFGEALRTI